MKTQIITLESHDDLISVRDRLSWAKTPRILLVCPKYEKVTLRQVDLKVLQRHAASLGAQLGLVTRQRRVRDDAEALGIPVFESTGQAQRMAWPKPRRRRMPHHTPLSILREKRSQLPAAEEAWRAHPAVRVGAFVVGVLAVLVLVALFIPRASVQLTPISKTQSVALPVTASSSVDAVFITGSVPLREKRVIVEGAQSVIVTGEGVVPQSKAKGSVEFRNLTQQEVTVPAGTIVQSEMARFVTTEDGVVDAGVGKKSVLTIEAVDGGLVGNVDAETINAIEGRLGLSLAVTNPEPITGGRELPSVQASDDDRARVKELVMKMMQDDAREKLKAEVVAGDMLFERTMKVSQILSEEYDLPPGAAGTKLTLSMRAEFSVQYADASDLSELATLAMNASLPPDFSPASDSLTMKPITTPQLANDGSVRWTMRVERRIVQQLDSAAVTSLIQGRGVRSAQSMLDTNLPLANAPVITLSPSWWQWIPIVPFRISVVTE
ncbi:MAG: hypothetical protein QM730_19550 [Anaerolineales bacterium]